MREQAPDYAPAALHPGYKAPFPHPRFSAKQRAAAAVRVPRRGWRTPPFFYALIGLVPRTRSSPRIAASPVANFGFKAALEL
jgi:hypothetical protein